MPIELLPLYTLHVQFRAPITIPGAPVGTRMIFEIESVEFEGEAIRGHMVGSAAADWVTVGPDGTATLDIRATVEVDGEASSACRRREEQTSATRRGGPKRSFSRHGTRPRIRGTCS